MNANQADTAKPSIAIAGAGLAGMCLAQSLIGEGFDVHLYESDEAPGVRHQGYRITVDKHGMGALEACLPTNLFELVTATMGAPGGYFRFTNRNLRDVFKMHFKAEPGSGGQVDRQTLHTILRLGLEDRIHYGKTATRVQETEEGALLHFSDGTKVSAAVVVGADGVNSALRAQVAPGCEPADSGFMGIYGRTRLVHNGSSLVPAPLAKSGVLAISDVPGKAFFFTSMRFHESPSTAFARLAAGIIPPVTDNYVMWGLVFPRDESPSVADRSDVRAVHERAVQIAGSYHPVLQDFVRLAGPEYTLLTGFASGQKPTVWGTQRATLMGDAVHVMPPFGAHGGNTALRDAALLGGKLKYALARGESLESAIESYQKEMVSYAFAAVRTAGNSMRQLNMGSFRRWLMLRVMTRMHRTTI